MRIIVDAFGGDHAPVEILKGCAAAADEYHAEIIVVGDKEKIKAAAKENKISLKKLEIVQAAQVMPVEAEPTELLKKYAGSSMAIGCGLLSEGKGDAFVSAGSTGALVVGASLIVKRLKGIKRVAIGTVIPSATGCYFLADAGANAECRPEMLVQFAMMGSAYMKGVMGIEKPRVGLVNIGAEEGKGTPLQQEAYRLLKASHLNFVGNVEPRDIPYGAADVVVADGFTGNVILKLTEGLGSYLGKEIKGMFTKNLGTKVGAAFVYSGIKSFQAKMDYKEYGGAPLLGASKVVIKAHGSSDAKAIQSAIRQAIRCCEQNLIGMMRDSLERMQEREQLQKDKRELKEELEQLKQQLPPETPAPEQPEQARDAVGTAELPEALAPEQEAAKEQKPGDVIRAETPQEE